VPEEKEGTTVPVVGGIPAGSPGLSSKEATELAEAEEKEKAERKKAAEKAAKEADVSKREGAPGLVESLTDPTTGEVHDRETVHGAVTAVSDISQKHFPVDAEGRPLNPAAAEAHAASLEASAEAAKTRAEDLRKDAADRDAKKTGSKK
jgi:hypothetical protein